jgi:hypothetical protein
MRIPEEVATVLGFACDTTPAVDKCGWLSLLSSIVDDMTNIPSIRKPP